MKVVITGHNGQLSSQFYEYKKNDKNWTFLKKNDLNISDLKSVISYFKNNKADMIINCAAFTDVNHSEHCKEMAFIVNHTGTVNLLRACEINNMKLIQFSTDYIFDGNSNIPYTEIDKPLPINNYGKSKLAGDIEVINSNVKSIIFRISWLYSNFGNNFVKKILNRYKNNMNISVIKDEIGSPTYAEDLVISILRILENQNYIWKIGDIFNYSNLGYCSRYEFATQIFEILGVNKKLSLKKQNLNKIRPSYTVLDNSKFKKTFGINLVHWKISLERMLKKEIL